MHLQTSPSCDLHGLFHCTAFLRGLDTIRINVVLAGLFNFRESRKYIVKLKFGKTLNIPVRHALLFVFRGSIGWTIDDSLSHWKVQRGDSSNCILRLAPAPSLPISFRNSPTFVFPPKHLLCLPTGEKSLLPRQLCLYQCVRIELLCEIHGIMSVTAMLRSYNIESLVSLNTFFFHFKSQEERAGNRLAVSPTPEILTDLFFRGKCRLLVRNEVSANRCDVYVWVKASDAVCLGLEYLL